MQALATASLCFFYSCKQCEEGDAVSSHLGHLLLSDSRVWRHFSDCLKSAVEMLRPCACLRLCLCIHQCNVTADAAAQQKHIVSNVTSLSPPPSDMSVCVCE